MKKANAYYRKNKTLDGSGLPDEIIDAALKNLSEPFPSDKPFPSYHLTGNNAEIKRLKNRLASLEKIKDTDFFDWEFKDGKAVFAKEDNRLRLFFDGKPDSDTRNALKHNGFRWAPSVKAWQRQLNANALYACDRLECIWPETGEKPSAYQKRMQSEI